MGILPIFALVKVVGKVSPIYGCVRSSIVLS